MDHSQKLFANIGTVQEQPYLLWSLNLPRITEKITNKDNDTCPPLLKFEVAGPYELVGVESGMNKS